MKKDHQRGCTAGFGGLGTPEAGSGGRREEMRPGGKKEGALRCNEETPRARTKTSDGYRLGQIERRWNPRRTQDVRPGRGNRGAR
jgi:hypothetical protein